MTVPTPEMRRVMAAAEVGDDVYGEDPTVNQLQETAARLVDKEEALFVSSGTMGNLLGALVNADSGSEAIVDSESHMFLYEVAGPGAIAGVQLRPVVTERGVISAEQIVAASGRPTRSMSHSLR